MLIYDFNGEFPLAHKTSCKHLITCSCGFFRLQLITTNSPNPNYFTQLKNEI